MIIRAAQGVCNFGIANFQRNARARTPPPHQQQRPLHEQQQLERHWQQRRSMVGDLQLQRVFASTIQLFQRQHHPTGASERRSSGGNRSNSTKHCTGGRRHDLGSISGLVGTMPSVVGSRCLLQRASMNSVAVVSQWKSSTSDRCGRDDIKWGGRVQSFSSKQRGVSHISDFLMQQRQQGGQQQEEGNLWWEDAETESQLDFLGATAAGVEGRCTVVRQQQQYEEHRQQRQQAYSMGAKDLGDSPRRMLVCAATTDGPFRSSAHHDAETAQLVTTKAAATAAATEGTGVAAGEVSLFLMASPLTPAERQELLCLWRRLSSRESLLKSSEGISEGPSLAALLEARWSLPASLFSAAHAQTAYLRWLYNSLQEHQEQQYCQAQQQLQQTQQEKQEQDCEQRQARRHEMSSLESMQSDAFRDLLQSIRGQFDLEEAAAARSVKHQPHERLQVLMQEWTRAVRGRQEGDLLTSTYRLLLEVCAAVDRPLGPLSGTPGTVKDPAVSPLLPPAAGPLLALYRIYLAKSGISAAVSYKNILKLVDLTTPELWFPVGRQRQRRVCLSLGPPNSGKTRGALEALLGAPSGCYMGPLRLLATEVYSELRKKGVRCSLITGPSKIIDPEATHVCSTVEAAPLDMDFSVGVIDEVQLLADPHRGPAWTRAFLGLRVRELHVCGEVGAEPLVKSLVLRCGDTIYREDRKASLASVKVETEALPADWIAALQPGDCLLAFSVVDCWRLKALLSASGVQAAMLYGQLPPEVRVQQIESFNEAVRMHSCEQQQHVQDKWGQQNLPTVHPDEAPSQPAQGAAGETRASATLKPEGAAGLADAAAGSSLPAHSVLIATDAIGLGVNLSIRRIIFTSTCKYDGISLRPLDASEVRQLAYRAGRFGGPWGAQGGLVSALQQDQLDELRTILEGPSVSAPALKAAALLPERWAFELFAHFAAGEPPKCTARLMQKFVSLLHTKAPYFIPAGALHKAVAVAALLRDVALPPPELYIFCMAPVSVSRCTQGHRNERHQEGGHSNMPESEDKAELPWQGAIDVDNSHSPEAAGTEGTGSDSAAAVTAAAASISLPMQAALRSFAVSLAATRVVPLPSPFRVVRKTDKEQQQHQRMQHLGLCSAEEGPWSSYTAAGVGYLGGTVDPASDGEETEATPAETIEALRAWETIYQVLDLYLWLAEKLPTAFVDAPLALSGRSLAADVIAKALQRERPLQGLGARDQLEQFYRSRMPKDLKETSGFRPKKSRETQHA